MRIGKILDEKGVSFEFFPPKTTTDQNVLLDTAKSLKTYNPLFVSVTYGAGGSTMTYTKEVVLRLKNELNLNLMAHLTCISHTQEELFDILSFYKKNNIDNILALRGDLPKNGKKIGCDHGYELVKFIKTHFDDELCIGVACYPETHPESPNMEWEMKYFKYKVDQGASFAITQMFFDNKYFYDFLELCQKHNINIPIIPGIMPITNFKQISKFASMCGATIPNHITSALENLNEEDVFKKGVEFAINQCQDLIDNGVKHLHFYTLNKSKATLEILKSINIS